MEHTGGHTDGHTGSHTGGGGCGENPTIARRGSL